MSSKVINYNYGYALSKNKKLLEYEKSNQIDNITEEDALMVRLDGKGLTKRFKTEDKLYLQEFHLAMRRVIENIRKYCSFITFAYSFKDEITFVLSKQYVESDKNYNNRTEKILSILSGYVSAMFSQYISPKLKEFKTEVFAFDARLIIIPKEKVNDYFHARQSFAMSAFIDRLCAFKHIETTHSYKAVVKYLESVNESWDNYPQYICSGYVGYNNENKWIVETASDFHQKWFKYEDKINY